MAAEVLDGQRGGALRIEARHEKTSTKQRLNTSSACTVTELVSMNCSADQPSSSSSPKRSSLSGPWARMPIASISAGTKRRMVSGSASRARSPSWRSIAASMPHGTYAGAAVCGSGEGWVSMRPTFAQVPF